MIKLYSYWRSTAAYRVRIALEFKLLEYELKPVHLVKEGGEQHHPEYRALNPMELVPTLVDEQETITESMAILEYLEEKYPQPSLLPLEKTLRNRAREISQIIACDIHPINNLRVLQYLKNELHHSQDVVNDWYHHWLHQGFKAIETMISKTCDRYCLGNELSFADVFLVPQVYNAARFKLDMKNYPYISQVNDNCLALDCFQKATPENQPDAH